MAVVPSIGRADRAAGAAPPEADLTRALYERYSAQIFRYCLHQLGSREEAEDAVQSAFLNAFRGIKRGVVPELESAWLFKIAENVCLSRRRSAWRRNRIESPTDFDVVEELAPAPSRLADELVGLQGVLEQMPESQRRAILLREWQGLSYREIAAELELSQTAVETLIFRARRSLAKGLEEPPAPAQKRRMLRGADFGNLLAGLKSLLFGGGAAAAKVAAVVAVVSAGTVVAASPARHHARTHTPAAPTTSAPAAPLPVAGLASTPPTSAPAPVHAAPQPAARVPAPAFADAPAPANPDTVVPAPPPASAPVDGFVDAPVTVVSRPAAQSRPAPGGHGGGSGSSGRQALPDGAGAGNSGSSSTGQGQGQGKGGPQGNGAGQGQGSGDTSGQGQGSGDSGQGQGQSSGQGSTDPSSGSGSTPPPAGGSSSGGNGGNGQGNGRGH
jgi:RNA polymerase sigma factor (sigma-70 family)